MKINIYYGGRGLIDDPTLYVINKMQAVLEELHVTVERFDLHELKGTITTLPQTLKTADGVILATTVEWFGIGGFMQQFLDACWLYADKEKLSKIYMCPIVMATTYGEREGKLTLSNAWEILGGLPCSGICGYIEDISVLEGNEDYTRLIEKKAENMYRTINQKVPSLPASNQAVKQKVYRTKNDVLTPQETEQLSQYAADDAYVQKQKEDISELASMFRNMMGSSDEEDQEEFIGEFRDAFRPSAGTEVSYLFKIKGKKLPLYIVVEGRELKIDYREADKLKVDAELTVEKDKIKEILKGNTSFQRAFMSGEMTLKGDFNAVRSLDTIFIFG
ncbi:MAG: SCP2 sterol-binding domain-containing protein [Lachnospiraceae bacterium]|nr:SCP2 sterol-binding domain-containing protein [Lachnospiraceae bacterium]